MKFMKSISSFEWTIVLLACLLYLIVDSAAGLPRAGPAGQTWPNIRFNLACQMFLVIKKFKLRRTLYYFFVFFHCLCGQIVWDLPNVIMIEWEWHFYISTTQSITIGVAFVPRSTIKFRLSALQEKMFGTRALECVISTPGRKVVFLAL